METCLVINALGTEAKGAVETVKMKYPFAKVLDTTNMNISPCVGCNHCWLKTPGVCSIRDDYEKILKSIIVSDRIILIGGTALGFINYQLKNIVDRILPIDTMMIQIVDGQERHVPRYDRRHSFGLLYQGDGDRAYLNRWMARFTLNMLGESLGAYPLSEAMEVLK